MQHSFYAWTPLSGLPFPPVPRFSSYVVVMDHRMILVGGVTMANTMADNVDAFDLDSNTWTALSPLPIRVDGLYLGVINVDMLWPTS